MNYKVSLTPKAKRQLREATAWYRERDSRIALNWYDGFLEAIFGIGENPRQYGRSHENDRFPEELHELLYGNGHRKTHRAIFRIVGDRVEVVAIRHLAQRELGLEDIS